MTPDAKTLSRLADAYGDPATTMRALIDACAHACGLARPYELPPADVDLTPLGDLAAWGAYELGTSYEQIIAKDDRDQQGAFYTPAPVADFLARFALGLDVRGGLYATPDDALDALVLDPSCGAGVVLEHAAWVTAVLYAALLWERPDPPRYAINTVLPDVYTATVYGVDIDPVAVEVARAACWLDVGGRAAFDFMADNITVGDPLAGHLPAALDKRLAEPVPLHIVGNPPYREHAKGAAPWLEARRVAGAEELTPRPSMDEFRASSRTDGKLANLWTFFWRWALWQALEARQQPGVVALVTPSAYLCSDTFAGMREHLRRTADEGWIIDLTPEGHQPPVPTRIFPGVKTPVAVGIFACRGPADTGTPAPMKYMAIEGAREEKFAALRQLVGVAA
ncbi:N-6 DNA methylase [Nonomuraea typhae]|uniref:N-6 DNA methylase n=1 Tax=Nonomuraea typhae TaxID=2603600 RepID=UPI0012F9C306|nr:N-6 DNA methylase [Nonomuraea typhae]